MKIKELENYHGVDKSNEISLFEYGLLVEYQKKDNDYHCFYKVGDQFSAGWIAENYLEGIIIDDFKKDLNSFLNYVGMNKKDWLKMRFINKLHDAIGYYGVENIMGNSYDTFKISED